MIFYQVQIETKDHKTIAELDKTDRQEVLNEIVIPYTKGEEFFVNGYYLKKDTITRIKIITTEESAEYLSEYENSHMSVDFIMYVSPESILDYSKYTTDITREILNEAKSHLKHKSDKHSQNDTTSNKDKVFLVHGKDNSVKQEVARFIEKLGLQPIILHEQSNAGMTIIEKLERYTDVGFGIILYTPCDIGYENLHEDQKKPRARQNVIFEHGYLTAKLGRQNVCALVKNTVEIPNDLSGIVYVTLDSNDSWELQLAQNMKSAGYQIDLNKIIP